MTSFNPNGPSGFPNIPGPASPEQVTPVAFEDLREYPENPIPIDGIDLESPRAPSLRLSENVQRTWSLLFGLRGSTQIPIAVNADGQLAVQSAGGGPEPGNRTLIASGSTNGSGVGATFDTTADAFYFELNIQAADRITITTSTDNITFDGYIGPIAMVYDTANAVMYFTFRFARPARYIKVNQGGGGNWNCQWSSWSA